MKNLFYILIASAFLFTSCQKEEIVPVNQEQSQSIGECEEGILLYAEWELLDGQMFVENLETGEMTVYDHFGPNKTTSSLRYSGSEFEFETIEQGETTWKFIAPPNWEGYGEFWLDNDSIQPYGLYVLGNNWSVVEHPEATGVDMQLGGSARPLSAVVENYDENIVVFTVQEGYESINGFNCKYYSELRFQKQ